MKAVSRGIGPLKERYRPQTLDEMAPTTNIARLAKIGTPNSSRVVLFEGPPGTAKTTSARIVARRVNCLGDGLSGQPCLNCASCVTLLGSSDYVEANAACERGIDAMRELTQSFAYQPMKGRNRKVYVLDEIHQLTGDAQEILLKHLEDPPQHILVILCTTSTKGVKKALLQRAEHFSFNSLTASQGIDYMTAVLAAEKREPPVPLRSIYDASGGSVREMLNLLQGALDGGRLEARTEDDEAAPEVQELFKALRNKSWSQARHVLANAEVRSKPESTRIGVENYVRAILLKESLPDENLKNVLRGISGSLVSEPVQISQYNLFVLKCLDICSQ